MIHPALKSSRKKCIFNILLKASLNTTLLLTLFFLLTLFGVPYFNLKKKPSLKIYRKKGTYYVNDTILKI